MLEKVHIIITITAALFVTIVCFITNAGILEFSSKVCITIVGFYTIGLFVKNYLREKVFVVYCEYDYEDDVPPIMPTVVSVGVDGTEEH